MTLNVQLPPVLGAAVVAYLQKSGVSLDDFVFAAATLHLKKCTDRHRLMSDEEYKATTWRAPWAAGHSLDRPK